MKQMSSDPVILDVLASICKDALQMFERIVIVFDDKAQTLQRAGATVQARRFLPIS